MGRNKEVIREVIGNLRDSNRSAEVRNAALSALLEIDSIEENADSIGSVTYIEGYSDALRAMARLLSIGEFENGAGDFTRDELYRIELP